MNFSDIARRFQIGLVRLSRRAGAGGEAPRQLKRAIFGMSSAARRCGGEAFISPRPVYSRAICG